MALTGFFAMLLASALIVLLIGAANIAGLLITRGVARQREFALRSALGAAKSRVVRQLLTETTILFMAGGAVGLILAYGITRALQRVSLPVPARTLPSGPASRCDRSGGGRPTYRPYWAR